MTTLAESLTTLERFLRERGLELPFNEVGIVEVGPGASMDDRGRLRIPRGEVHSPESYSPRFEQLTRLGLPWINLSAYGLGEGRLIVAVEIPNPPARRSDRTSINYSGPPAGVLKDDFRVDSILLIEP